MDSIEKHPLMTRYINYYKKLKECKLFNCFALETLKISVITSPFFVFAISKQLSVPKNRELYADSATPKASGSKEVMPLENQITLREAKNRELIKSSGVLPGQKPYRAPIYDSYLDIFKGLKAQGILAFYKGALWRYLWVITTARIRITLEWFLRERGNFLEKANFIRELIALTIVDMICHPAFLIESRYVLQNRIPQFQVYTSLIKFKTRSQHEFLNGILSHFPKNCLYLIGFHLTGEPTEHTQLVTATLLGHTFMYPILTCMRRLVCQTANVPGMLPLRYLNLLHAFALIRREEGIFKGLYKGYLAYSLGLYIWMSFADRYARLSYYKKVVEDENLFIKNDPVFEEIMRRKLVSTITEKDS